MQTVERILSRIEAAAAVLAAAIIVSAMLIVVADVICRYAFNSPIAWAYDIIANYMMVSLFYLVLSGAFADGSHVNVDLLHSTFPQWLKHVTDALTCFLSAGLFVVVAFIFASEALGSYREGQVLYGVAEWPTWPFLAMASLGSALLTLRLTLHFVAHLMGIFSGTSVLAPTTSEAPSVLNRSGSDR
ncbi:MAG: TRAP transporter small permease [Hyphomicrobium sp.]|jgi:TRAP-type C4-dicarboxylate transport system permease small subunit|nr:TRAP transporter small permease [Hyphomicrobium sp.]